MPDTAQDVYTTINGLCLHYRQWGQTGQQPLVLLHASGCHAHWWDWVGPMLAAAPVLVVHGALSPLMPAANAARVAQDLPQGQWTTLPNAYHNLMLDNPSGFVQVVRDFFATR